MTNVVPLRPCYRKDGWPLCPCCGEDELASFAALDAIALERPLSLDDYFNGEFYCYRCLWTGRMPERSG